MRCPDCDGTGQHPVDDGTGEHPIDKQCALCEGRGHDDSGHGWPTEPDPVDVEAEWQSQR